MTPVDQIPIHLNSTIRMNGFATLLAFLACIPALVYRKIDVSFATKNYYHLMTSTLLCSVLSAAGAYVKSRWAKKSALNPKVNTVRSQSRLKSINQGGLAE